MGNAGSAKRKREAEGRSRKPDRESAVTFRSCMIPAERLHRYIPYSYFLGKPVPATVSDPAARGACSEIRVTGQARTRAGRVG